MDKKENTVVLFPQLSERYIDEGFFSAERAEIRRCIALL